VGSKAMKKLSCFVAVFIDLGRKGLELQGMNADVMK
jgi:hypothetical protein